MNGSSRVRTRGKFVNTCPQTQNQVRWSTGCSQPNWTNSGAPYGICYTGEDEVMYDTVTPRWNTRRAHGEIIMNSMQYTKREASIAGIEGNHFRTNSPIVCSGATVYSEQRSLGAGWFPYVCYLGSTAGAPLNVGSAISNSDVEDLISEVSTKALADRGNSQNNLFESIAEYRQTLSLLKNPLNSVHTVLSRASGVLKKGGDISSAYLIFRYGVMPLVKDVTGIIQGLEKKVGNMRVTTRASGSISQSGYVNKSFNAGAFVFNYGIQTSDSLVVRAMSLDEYFVSKTQNIGFASKGLVTLPWELIPYSFVFDWFVNLGDYIKALVPLPSLKNLGMCLTTYRARQSLYQSESCTAAGGYTMLLNPSGSCFSSVVQKSRTPSLVPKVIVKSDFRFDSAVRTADAVALIVQRMSSIFGKR